YPIIRFKVSAPDIRRDGRTNKKPRVKPSRPASSHLTAGRTKHSLNSIRQFRMVTVLLVVATCTASAWAAQDITNSEDGGCREIAGQIPHTASVFGHGLISSPRNAIQ